MFTLRPGSICPKVGLLLQPPSLALNKHSQTSDQLTPATGIPSVCRDDGGLLLSTASAVGSEACGESAGWPAGCGGSSMLHMSSPTCAKLFLYVS